MDHPTQARDSFRHHASRWRQGAAALLCSLAAGFTAAQAATEAPNDPPGRVGRIAELVGQVQFYSPSVGEWAAATRNRPVTDGDRIATEASGRAELRIGSTTLRLDSASELEVLRIDDARMELQLHNGSVSVRLRNREAVDEFELRTGEGRFRAQRSGRYRIDRIDEASHLTVNSGAMVYEGPGSALTVYSGQRAEFWLDRANVAQYSLTEPKRDAFATWNAERDRQDDRSASARYVSPEMTGVEELDRYGRWETSDEYGALWVPRSVAAGWAPYSSGHWIWVRPWGWTWVDDAPWGFAPFHYGRWVWFGSRWCWAPGTRVLRPVYAPALVAWVGGPHVSVSVQIGGPTVGWFPLAPREVYVPSYYHSPRYIREVNVTHVTNISNVTVYNQPNAPQRDFSNRKFPHAVTVVPTSVMTQRQPVAPAAAQWRERKDHGDVIREVTRGTPLIAAPVDAPPQARLLESQRITSPGVAGAATSPAAPPGGQRNIGRPGDERRGDERRGEERRGDDRRADDRRGDDRRGDEIRSVTRPGLVTPGATAPVGPQRPNVVPAPGPTSAAATPTTAPIAQAAPPAPAVVAATPPAPVTLPRPQPSVPTPRPAPAAIPQGPTAPAAAPAVAPTVAALPNPGVAARPPMSAEPRHRQQPRPAGNEVPAAPPRAEAAPQPQVRAQPTDRTGHAERQAREHRGEVRRDARGERQQAN